MKHISPLLAGMLFLLFCSQQSFLCNKPKAPEYKAMENFKIEQWGFRESKVRMDIVYFNPNNFGVQFKKADCDIYIDKNYLGHFILDSLIHIPRKNDFRIPVVMNVDMKHIMKNAVNTLFNKEVLVTVKGTARVGKGGIFFRFPVSYEGKHQLSMFQ
jgi:LEA14-like dessication related protein